MPRLTLEDWDRRLRCATRNLSADQYWQLMGYEETITKAIWAKIKGTRLGNLLSIHERVEMYAIELLIKFLPDIIPGSPSKALIRKRTGAMTSKRIGTWFKELRRQEETAVTRFPPMVVEMNEGEISDIGFVSEESDYGPDGVNPYWKTPETLCIENQERGFIAHVFRRIGSGKRKHKDTYITIYSAMLRGDRPGSEDAGELGIPENRVASRVFESKKLFQKVLADISPETAERWKKNLAVDVGLKGMGHKDLCLIGLFLFGMKWRGWHGSNNSCSAVEVQRQANMLVG